MDGTRSDRPSEAAYREARGPRLPDAVRRLPWLAWVFIVLAIGDFAWFVINADSGSTASIADIGSHVLRIVASVAAVLLPAALLARHPDARTSAPSVLFGTILYALVQGMLVLGQPLQSFFEGLTPPSEDLPGLVPLAAIYDGLIGLVGAFAVIYLGSGLAAARRFEDRAGRWTAIVVPVAAVLASIVGVAAVARIDLSGIAMTPTLALYLGGTVILGILPVVAWAYLTTVGVRGWRAGEDPIVGWRLVAVAGVLVLVALALVDVGGVLDVQDQTTFQLYGYTIAGAYALGHVCLVVAFLAGLPALDDDDLDDEEEVACR